MSSKVSTEFQTRYLYVPKQEVTVAFLRNSPVKWPYPGQKKNAWRFFDTVSMGEHLSNPTRTPQTMAPSHIIANTHSLIHRLNRHKAEKEEHVQWIQKEKIPQDEHTLGSVWVTQCRCEKKLNATAGVERENSSK